MHDQIGGVCLAFTYTAPGHEPVETFIIGFNDAFVPSNSGTVPSFHINSAVRIGQYIFYCGTNDANPKSRVTVVKVSTTCTGADCYIAKTLPATSDSEAECHIHARGEVPFVTTQMTHSVDAFSGPINVQDIQTRALAFDTLAVAPAEVTLAPTTAMPTAYATTAPTTSATTAPTAGATTTAPTTSVPTAAPAPTAPAAPTAPIATKAPGERTIVLPTKASTVTQTDSTNWAIMILVTFTICAFGYFGYKYWYAKNHPGGHGVPGELPTGHRFSNLENRFSATQP